MHTIHYKFGHFVIEMMRSQFTIFIWHSYRLIVFFYDDGSPKVKTVQLNTELFPKWRWPEGVWTSIHFWGYLFL